MNINLADPLTLLLIFGAGISVKSLFAIKRWKDLLWWGASWFLALYGAARIYKNHTPTLEQFLLATFLAFGFMITLFLYKNILPRIREHSLLIMTLIFLYSFVKYVLFHYPDAEYLLLLALIPSVLIIYLSFVNLQLAPYFKLFFYIWFILMNVFFIFFYLFSNEISLWDYSKLHFASPYDAFLTGFTAFTLMANLCFIYMLVLPGDKHDSWEERKRKWKEYANILISRHDDSQLRLYQTILILTLGGGGLLLNYFFGWISDGVQIPTYLFLSQSFLPTTPVTKNIVATPVTTGSQS